jgi:NAD(P)-dependent dehydrogenase (short-subunit alcohol dehydrogenase family)
MRISGSAFIVTGGSSGLGEATVRQLHAEGARVVIADVATDKGEALAKALGDNARFVRTDVSSEADGQAAVGAALSQFGGLHGLVNCAGIAPGERMLGKNGPHALATFTRGIQVNLIGTFNMIRLAAQAMSEQAAGESGERGVIVNTASIAAYEGQIGQATYSASKAGIVGMTLPIARDLARNGIRVVTIAPGLFLTPLMATLPTEVQDSLGKSTPFPTRLGRPDEFAALVSHIVANQMINGETIRLDGAVRLTPR